MTKSSEPPGDVSGSDVALFINNLHGHGAQRVVTTLANSWARAGWGVCVITLTDEGSDYFALDEKVRRIVVGLSRSPDGAVGRLLINVRRALALRRAVRAAGVPIVTAFLIHNNLLTVLAAKGFGLRVVLCERNDPERETLAWPIKLLRRLLYRQADVVTSNSRGVLEILKAYVPEDKLAFVPNPLVVPESPGNVAPGMSTVLTVGRLSPQKAHDVLLKAFAQVAPGRSDWRLAVLGDGELREPLRRLAASLELSDRVDWLGQRPDPFAHYRAADIFALASRFEGTPNALLEAMACGLAVVVSDTSPGPLEYVDDGVTGLVVPVDDARALAGALERLMSDPDLRRRLGTAARTRVAESALPHALATWERVLGLPLPADTRPADRD